MKIRRKSWMLAGIWMLYVMGAGGCLNGEGGATSPTGSHLGGKADDPTVDFDDIDAQIGGVFLMEHYFAEVSPTVVRHIKAHPPGGILFWNGNHADAVTLRAVIATYSEAAREAGHAPLLYSADYEGGALRRSLSWSSIPGIQRFRKGFTDLAHPRWLGAAYRLDPELGRELAWLHGKIIGREMRSVGINFPLSVVSDLAYGLFAVRGIDRDEEIVAALIQEVINGAMTEPQVVFVTKHFAGLGQTSGDTHDGTVVSRVEDEEEAERHLLPFRSAIALMDEMEDPYRLSIMCSHAMFPFYDPEHKTTVSHLILQGLLRENLVFRGIAVSDAMWMGEYGEMGRSQVQRVYLASFLAGMDMLMIPGSRYSSALGYFQDVYHGTLSGDEIVILEEELGLPWEEIHAAFLKRLEESLLRLAWTQSRMTHAVEAIDDAEVNPADETVEYRERYHQILKLVDERWESELR